MFKLIKFLKPFIFPLVIAIALLFMQAQADLALPDYMSKIVNIGIQQRGITDTVPNVLSKEDFENINKTLSDNEKIVFEKSYLYTPLSENQKDNFPLLKDSAYLLVENSPTIQKLTKKALISRVNDKLSTSNSSDKIGNLDQTILEEINKKAIQTLYVSYGYDLEKAQNHYILKSGGLMLLISLLGALCSISVVYISSKIAAKLATNLRHDIFTKVESFSNNEFDKFSTATLITRSTNDVTQILTLLVVMIRMLFYAPIIGLGGIVKALERSSSMSSIIIISVLILIGIIGIIFSLALPKFKIVQKKLDRVNLVLRENLQGMSVIRAFNSQTFEEKRFDDANKDLTNINIFVNQIMVVLFPAMMLIMNGATIAISWVGAHEIANSNMHVGDMMAFMQYAIQIIFSFLMLSFMFILVPRATVSAERIAEVLETDISIKDSDNPQNIDKTYGKIEFKNVSFKYNGAEENALDNITFTANNGETTAIIGSTGSGKTTLVNLIPRFYEATKGEILVNGINVKNLLQKDLRDIIGYIPQKASLFSGTLESNLKYADENASKELIERAIRVSQSHDFITEKGYDTEISQGGINLSGGQKQRVSIARALVKNPPIYIFDDSFSALDFKTDSLLRKSLHQEVSGSTLLIVAQRVSTIKNANKIIVLDDGKIVGEGTHQELLHSCKIYQEIALSQLSKEELE